MLEFHFKENMPPTMHVATKSASFAALTYSVKGTEMVLNKRHCQNYRVIYVLLNSAMSLSLNISISFTGTVVE